MITLDLFCFLKMDFTYFSLSAQQTLSRFGGSGLIDFIWNDPSDTNVLLLLLDKERDTYMMLTCFAAVSGNTVNEVWSVTGI